MPQIKSGPFEVTFCSEMHLLCTKTRDSYFFITPRNSNR